MGKEINISGVSENLADSIADQGEVKLAEKSKTFLHGKKIAISVSECEDLELLGLSDQHLTDVSIEIARYLIVNGGTLLYGGDLREKGFTNLFAELSFQYKYIQDKERRFVNYFPFPNSRSITLDVKTAFFKQQVEPIILDLPKHLDDIDTAKAYKPLEDLEDRYVFSECLADMRIKMASDCNARIVVGGRQKGYLGYLPGIAEEAYHTMLAEKPIYILGGFGGAAKSLTDAILGRQPEKLRNENQYHSEFLKKFKETYQGKTKTPTDFTEVVMFFNGYSIEKLSSLNGLTVEENQIIFESTNIHELVYLIIKGLKNVLSK